MSKIIPSTEYFMYLLNEGWQRSKNEFEESRDVREEAVVSSWVRHWLWGTSLVTSGSRPRTRSVAAQFRLLVRELDHTWCS